MVSDYDLDVPNHRDYMTDIESNSFTHDQKERMARDLTQTVLYQSTVQVKKGKAKGTFFLSDLITKFRITVEGFDVNGVIGQEFVTVATIDTLVVATELPKFMVAGDSYVIPVSITNFGLGTQAAQLFETIQDPSLTVTVPKQTLKIAAGKTAYVDIQVVANYPSEVSRIQIKTNATVGKVLF
jgi:uncharacterized protein YfaS (alpha-2-macroglobulin family)